MASLRTLINETRIHGRASASAGRWTGRREGFNVIVRHFTTDMFSVDILTDEVIAISRGWGSMTDKRGTTVILQGYGINQCYNAIYDA